MRIIAIDPGTRTGISIGDSAKGPDSYSILVGKPNSTPEDRSASLAAHLSSVIRAKKPELMAVEAYLSPYAQPAFSPAVISLMLHGAVSAIAGLYKIPLIPVAPATWRKHFLGITPKGRKVVKAAVLARAKLIGYLPNDCNDDDRAESLGLWDYATAKYGRTAPKEIILFRN
jgi:Holliday junction resolvasome RuvABC endonuclease subunit